MVFVKQSNSVLSRTPYSWALHDICNCSFTFTRFHKSQCSPQTPQAARAGLLLAHKETRSLQFSPPATHAPPGPTPQLAAFLPVTELHMRKKKKRISIGFISGSRQSKHSFKEHITACSCLETRRVSSSPAPGSALPYALPSGGRGAASPHTCHRAPYLPGLPSWALLAGGAGVSTSGGLGMILLLATPEPHMPRLSMSR